MSADMVRRFGIATLILVAVATTAAAEESPAKPVFITQQAIEMAARPARYPPPTFDFEIGAVQYRNRYGRARLAYLPLLAILPHTFPSRDWNQFANPFELTGTQMAQRYHP